MSTMVVGEKGAYTVYTLAADGKQRKVPRHGVPVSGPGLAGVFEEAKKQAEAARKAAGVPTADTEPVV